MRVIIFAFLGAAVAGFLGAKLVSGEVEADRHGPEVRRERETRKTARWKANDFEKWVSLESGLSDPFSGQWKDWSDAELVSALDEGVKDAGAAMDSSAERKVMSALLGEWMRRDPDRALAWFEGMVSESMRWGLISAVTENWPPERASEGLEYVIAHRDWFESDDKSGSARLIRGAMEQAAQRGADSVGELFGKLRENRLRPDYGGGWQFPADFDFAALARHPETLQGKITFFAGVWMSRNPEEAFAHLSGGLPSGETNFKNLFADVLPRNGSTNREAAATRAEWLADKVNESPDADRIKLIQSICEGIDDGATRGRFVGGIQDEAARAVVLQASIEELKMKRNGVRGIVDFISYAFHGDQRLDALENMKRDGIGLIPEVERSMLESRLKEWNAAPDRSEKIMEKFPSKLR